MSGAIGFRHINAHVPREGWKVGLCGEVMQRGGGGGGGNTKRRWVGQSIDWVIRSIDCRSPGPSSLSTSIPITLPQWLVCTPDVTPPKGPNRVHRLWGVKVVSVGNVIFRAVRARDVGGYQLLQNHWWWVWLSFRSSESDSPSLPPPVHLT